MEDIEIKEGKHKGEVAVVVETLDGGIRKVLTLGGLIYLDTKGKEVCPWCLGTKRIRSIFGVSRCQYCCQSEG